MAQKKLGKQTISFTNPPYIVSSGTVVGTKEGQGPLAEYFDEIISDEYYNEKTWEKAESKLQKSALAYAIKKAEIKNENIDYLFAGDLLNQCSASHYGLADSNIPFFGLFGACSTMAESLSLGAMAIDGGYADAVAAMTSSHFCGSEKQFRFALEYGGQRPPTAQWTVTGAGCAILKSEGTGPRITHITTGKIVDMGIKDANNMGAAMAPAAADTIVTHFKDTGLDPTYYDLIITGDLASIGYQIARDMVSDEGIDITQNYNDCGNLIFDIKKQDVHAGASGCGCSAAVFCGYLMNRLQSGDLNKILLVCTGALMSPLALLQGETIPCIAHAVSIERNV